MPRRAAAAPGSRWCGGANPSSRRTDHWDCASPLSRIAQQFGSGDLQLTSRASMQLRGLPDPVPDSLIRAVREAGFLPSDTHERVRNIVASPLTGISGGLSDVRPLVAVSMLDFARTLGSPTCPADFFSPSTTAAATSARAF